jgi:hypothetical protein
VSRETRPWSAPFVGFVVVMTAFFGAQELAGADSFFTKAPTATYVALFASLVKLAGELAGAALSIRAAMRSGEGNPARRGWLLLGASLGAWFAGQLVLAYYERILGIEAPLPSLGDAFFTVGCLCAIMGLWTFVNAYRRSGFAAGSFRQDLAIALASGAVFSVISFVLLAPVALAPTPLLERIINVGYPIADFLTLIPLLVLLRITLGFRGGQVWQIWALLLVGFGLVTVADIAYADPTPAHVAAVKPLVDLTAILGYAFCARGAQLQYRMVAVAPGDAS